MNAEQFRNRMSELPEPTTDKKPPYWEAWRLDLWRRAQTQTPLRFWQWPCVYHTMLVNHWPGPVEFERDSITDRNLLAACSVPHSGPDDPFPDSGLSMNLIHQAYHIQQWQQVTGKRINQLQTIVEFGGGYGAMALLCHRLGFDGKYIIYDLPEFSLLQEYYLSQFGLLATMEWNPKRKPKGIDLFMALYSLSEVEPKKRKDYLVDAQSYLYLYSGQWEQWDNVNYFQDGVTPTKKWQHTELTHLPDKNNWYSIGF